MEAGLKSNPIPWLHIRVANLILEFICGGQQVPKITRCGTSAPPPSSYSAIAQAQSFDWCAVSTSFMEGNPESLPYCHMALEDQQVPFHIVDIQVTVKINLNWNWNWKIQFFIKFSELIKKYRKKGKERKTSIWGEIQTWREREPFQRHQWNWSWVGSFYDQISLKRFPVLKYKVWKRLCNKKEIKPSSFIIIIIQVIQDWNPNLFWIMGSRFSS